MKKKSLYPIEQEYKLSKTFKNRVNKILKQIKPNDDLNNLKLEIPESEKKRLVDELSKAALEINNNIFEGWKTLTDDDLKRQDLEEAKAWIKVNYEIFNKTDKAIIDKLERLQQEKVDNVVRTFNKSFDFRVQTLENGSLSKIDLSKMLTELKSIPNPPQDIKNMIEKLSNTSQISKEEITGLQKWANNRNELWARNETGNLYSNQLKDLWLENEIDEYIWRTSEDDAVRPEHEARANRVYRISDGDELPGEGYGCRCWAEPVKATEKNKENESMEE